ncbi:MAG TPA: MBL fold metallo-hydrolase, partial [Vicinamibacterales bacterium]|nr:MBL fold metallo-hydrolase [Vicinamibacterales bacterium]
MNASSNTLSCLGAARTVTGSKHLVEVDGRLLLVDCGMFQGLKELRERNWQPLPVPPHSIEAVVLTHAHLDHCGLLPRLVSQGFKGRIFCTPATLALAKIVLADAAKLQEEDAERANRRHYTKHQPALPLFTSEDADRAAARLQPVGYARAVPVMPGVTVEFLNAGHLLGSAFARLSIASTGQTLLFGGDLGRFGRPVLPDPAPVPHADLLVVESTYGDRQHPADDNGAELASIVTDTAAKGGKVIIPAFALGRVEELLYWIDRLENERRMPELPVYVDSPMAAAVLQSYRERLAELDPEIREQ